MSPHARRRPSPLRVAALALLLAALGVLVGRLGLDRPKPTTARIGLPPGVDFPTNAAQFALSPDGRQIALNLRSGTTVQVWTWALAGLDARPLTGTEGVTSLPAWSADGLNVAFVAGGTLRRIPADGGPVQALYDVSPDAAVDWSRDDTMLVAPGGDQPIRRVLAGGGGTAQAITRLNPGEQHLFPRFVSGTRRFLFSVAADARRDGLWLSDLDSRASQRVAPHAVNGSVVGDFLVHSLDQLVIAQRFDQGTAELTGVPVTLADHVRIDDASRRLAFSVAVGGDALAYQSDLDGALRLTRNWKTLTE